MSTRQFCKILEAIREKPMNRTDLAKHLGLSVHATTYHLEHLEEFEIIERLIGPKGATGPHCYLYTVSKRWRNN